VAIDGIGEFGIPRTKRDSKDSAFFDKGERGQEKEKIGIAAGVSEVENL
jgi:hypothetical protein